MRRLSPGQRLIAMALVVLPFWVSILVRTYAWIVVLGNDGVVNRTLTWLGLIEGPLPILYAELGVTIGTANILLPFLVLPLFAAMLKVDNRLLDAAASLGASRRTIFWRVFFPLTVRSEEHTSELQSLMRISYAVFCLKKKNQQITTN